MSKLIDADDPKLRGKLKFICEAERQIYGRASWCFSAKCEAAINETQTVDAIPVIHGKWVNTDDGFCCNKCNHHAPRYKGIWLSNFCPNCGALMDGKGDGNGQTELDEREGGQQ